MTDEQQREYRSLSQFIAAMTRQLRSRRRDDVAARPQTQKAIDEAKAKRDALLGR